MQIRCQQCQRPFALGKEATLTALAELEQKKLHHYNAICPHCGRTNRISSKALKRAAPRRQAPEQEITNAKNFDPQN